MATNGFFKIRARELRHGMQIDYLDQTRINHESYSSAYKICKDAYTTLDADEKDQHVCVNKVIETPDYLKNLVLDEYYKIMEGMDKANIRYQIQFILEELRHPFADPRKMRSPDEPHISNERLFYLLIDETKRTFKKGLIVTATVNKVFENLAMCKLENGLKAIVHSSSFHEEKLEAGHIV